MPVDRATIRDLCTDAVFERGVNYRQEGRIHRLNRFGDTITARVQGTQLYDVRLDLGSDDYDPSCTCPYSGPGECKHIVAVLLAIVDDCPDDDARRIDGLLDDISTHDLHEFLREELARDPAMRERFLAAFDTGQAKSADEYRSDVDHLFEAQTTDSPVVIEAIDFSQFTDIAENYRERGEYEQAAAVYRGLSEGIAENMHLVEAAYDHYAQTFQSALDGYVECVTMADLDEEQRQSHREYLSERSQEAVDYLGERYARALDTLDAEQ